jgi:hypothetical protein
MCKEVTTSGDVSSNMSGKVPGYVCSKVDHQRILVVSVVVVSEQKGNNALHISRPLYIHCWSLKFKTHDSSRPT